MNHLHNRPDRRPLMARGYTPDEPIPVWLIATTFIAWLVVLAAGISYTLPLIAHMVRWVVGHD